MTRSTRRAHPVVRQLVLCLFVLVAFLAIYGAPQAIHLALTGRH
ncbi:hypothetical protein [Agromyces sp. SYSU T00194]